ncbi:YneF family protein [Streptococcus sp. DD13]|uniref:YneF family protein n=1 Tax=Streptococcus sp. DD13 TaxID=1777881 RepID=UPI000794738C|nr:YneF family protein [Streptococcus sp. DD13]KXT78190.1 hypothetical protein STRDD13_00908 [Streptococcus sp. DD13]
MPIWIAILLIIVALLGGMVLGAFLARRQVQSFIADKPILDENALRVMMSNMGQKPSEAKIQQTLRQIKASQRQGKK